MSSFMFATCDRQMALGFLRKIYSRPIEDTPEDAGPLLDIVEADIVRIPDPAFHRPDVMPSTNWDESRREELIAICRKFHEGPQQ